VAFVTSWAGTLALFDDEIWWELATLITIMLLGHWLEMRSIAQAQGALSALAALLPDTTERVTANDTEEVPIAELRMATSSPCRRSSTPGGGGPPRGALHDPSQRNRRRRPASPNGRQTVPSAMASANAVRIRAQAVAPASGDPAARPPTHAARPTRASMSAVAATPAVAATAAARAVAPMSSPELAAFRAARAAGPIASRTLR
jgi:hypothetical protein